MYEKFVCINYCVLVIIVPNVIVKKKQWKIQINVERPEYMIWSLEAAPKIHQMNNRIMF